MTKTNDINNIIAKKLIRTFFQPLVSIRQKSIIGLESLTRGIDETTGKFIPPDILFSMAETAGLTVELDRLCRELAMATFINLPQSQELFLALNFKTSIIDQGVVGSGHLLNQVCHYGLNPGNIIIEIVESEVKNITALADFVRSYKEHGFLIALDDFGVGYSNLDRLAIIKPDIIKIDRLLLYHLDQEYYKQEMVKSLIQLTHKLGALALAEGIEILDDTLLALELGADLLQGYYFGKPVPANAFDFGDYQGLLDSTADLFKNTAVERTRQQQVRNDQFYSVMNHCIRVLMDTDSVDFDQKLTELIHCNSSLECIYILDEAGIQASNTIFNQSELPIQRRNIFNPAIRGADQSLKEYYLPIKAGLANYITEPYISSASGNACITVSAIFINTDHLRYILCLDIKA